jgi:ubiquinone/menaquinone biosynthesis C-methylase UbiE
MSDITNTQRIIQVLAHLGVEKAHFAASMAGDWNGLVENYVEWIGSLSLVCPVTVNSAVLESLASKLLLISGDQPPYSERISQALNGLPGAQHLALEGYSNLLWNDPIGDHPELIGSYLLKFLKSKDDELKRFDTSNFATSTGEVAGVSYQLQGRGTPLVLLPLGLAPTQWDRLLATLSEHYFTILLGGPELGILPLLEHRGRSSGYQRLLRNLFFEIKPQSGEHILEVGCGSGVINRWLAKHTNHQNPMIGLDINPYLLREAKAIAHQEGFGDTIGWREGNAEALPFDDDSFDVTFAVTVMEEVNAKRMLADMIRVTKPGGRIGVIVRALDLPRPTSVPLRPELKLKCEAPPPAAGSEGSCSSLELYRHFHQAELSDVCVFPDFTVFNVSNGVVETFLHQGRQALLTSEENKEWQNACDLAVKDGTFFLTWPHHCAVGKIPV